MQPRVTDEQMEELRERRLSWFKYAQARMTRSHRDSIKYLTRYRVV